MSRWQFILAFGSAAGLLLFLVASFAGLFAFSPLHVLIGLSSCLWLGCAFGFVLDVLL